MSTIREINAKMTERDRIWNLAVRWHRGWHGVGLLRECPDITCQEAFHEYIGQYERPAAHPEAFAAGCGEEER
jgi:hypothetical protein